MGDLDEWGDSEDDEAGCFRSRGGRVPLTKMRPGASEVDEAGGLVEILRGGVLDEGPLAVLTALDTSKMKWVP